MAVVLNSTTKYITQGTAAYPQGDSTFSLWFNPTWVQNDGAPHHFFSIADVGNVSFMDIQKAATNLFYAGWFVHSEFRAVNGSLDSNQNAWNLLTLTVDVTNGVSKSYINNTLKGTATGAITTANLAGILRYIGIEYTGNNSIQSAVSHMGIWSRVLNATERLNLLTQTPRKVSSTNLTDYLSMDAARISGATIAAEIGTNGTLVGSPSTTAGPPLTDISLANPQDTVVLRNEEYACQLSTTPTLTTSAGVAYVTGVGSIVKG